MDLSEIQLPPHDPDAERCVLGSLMFLPAAIDEISSLISSNDFYVTAHSGIFTAITNLVAKNCPAIDVVTIADELHSMKVFESVGGVPYLMEIMEAVPHASHVRYYAKIVQQHSVRRQLIDIGRRSIMLAHDRSQEIFEVSSRTITRIEEILGQGSEDVRSLAEVVASLRKRQENPIAALSTGLIDLDFKLKFQNDQFGGFYPTQLIVIGARPAMGKTAFGTGLIEASAEVETPSLFIALEMDGEDIAQRMERVSKERLDYLASRPVYMEDRAFDIDSLVSKIRLAYRRKGVRFVVVDYLGLIELHDSYVKDKNGVITRRLKMLAKELRIPIVLLAQLNRECEKRDDKRPRLSDLRDSGSIEQDADVVMFLYRHEVYYQDEKPGVCEVIIAKSRNGATGTVEVGYLKEQTRFVSREKLPVDVNIDGLFTQPHF